MTSPSPPQHPGRNARRAQPALPPAAWIAPACLVVGALVLGRFAIARELALEGRGADPASAAFGIAARFLPELVNALVLGAVAGALALRGLGRGGRLAALLGTFALLSVVLFVALLGWPGADARDVPTRWAPPGHGLLSGLRTLAGAALLGAALLLILGQVARGSARAARWLAARPVIVLAALLGLVAPFARMTLMGREAPQMPLRTVVRDLLSEPGALLLRGEPAQRDAVRPATLAPAVDWRYDVADKPSLVLPPGSEVEFSVRPEDGSVRLLAAAGVDISVRPQGGGSFHLRFQAERNGELVFDERRAVRPPLQTEPEERAWLHVGGEGGLELEPGDRVLLRTLLEDEGREFAPPEILCGFGGLILERSEAAPRSSATRERPNVLLVVMDTLRADRMSCYGYAKPTTPHADRLAARGLLFEEAYATSPWTWPSTASILTGLDPEEHGVTSNASCTLALSNQSLPELLQTRGFSTGGFSGNPLIAPERYFDQGFEAFHATPQMQMSDGLCDEILGWIDRHADVRFFLYLQLVDPHTPHHPLASELARLGGEMPADYPQPVHEGEQRDGMDYYTSVLNRPENLDPLGQPRPELVPAAHRQWISDVYDASVGTGDHYFGLVLERLERLGLTDKTLVVFTSDHGEELFDHGCLAHGHTLHRELVRVPLLIAGPGVPQGVRIKHTVSNRHIAPTLARVAGAELGAVQDPVFLLGDLAQVPARALFSTAKGHWNGNRGEPLYGLRDERYSLHWSVTGRPYGAAPGSGPIGGERRLYDAWNDPGELHDLGGSEAEHAAELRRILELELRAQRARRLAPAIGIGAGALDMLRGVGYVSSENEPVKEPPR